MHGQCHPARLGAISNKFFVNQFLAKEPRRLEFLTAKSEDEESILFCSSVDMMIFTFKPRLPLVKSVKIARFSSRNSLIILLDISIIAPLSNFTSESIL